MLPCTLQPAAQRTHGSMAARVLHICLIPGTSTACLAHVRSTRSVYMHQGVCAQHRGDRISKDASWGLAGSRLTCSILLNCSHTMCAGPEDCCGDMNQQALIEGSRRRRCRIGFLCSRMFPECPHWMLSGGRAGAASPGSCPQQSARGIGADGGAAGTERRQGEAAEPHAHAQGRTCTFVSQHCEDFALLCHVTQGGAAAGHTACSAPLGSLLIILSD